MRNYPTIILDKSTLKSVSTDEIRILQQHYTIIVPQILVNEILGELSHEKEDLNLLKKNIKRLAEKLSYHDTIFYPDAQSIAMNELLTGQILPFDGKPIFFNAKKILAKDGSLGIYIEEQEELKILRRWEVGNFTLEDAKHSSNFFNLARNFDLNELKRKINFDTSAFDKNTNVKQIFEAISNAFSYESKMFFEEALSYLFFSFKFSEQDKEKILYRLKNFSGKTFKEFSPYANYFFLVLLTFTTGLKTGAISTSKNKKAHLDIEYFLYLPFVNCISSYDKDFIGYFNAFYKDGQIYFNGDEIRREINLIKMDIEKISNSKNSFPKITHNEFSSQSYKLWRDKYIPTKFDENLTNKLSPEEQKSIIEKIMKPINEGIDLQTAIPLNEEYANQYNSWDLKKRTNEILIKAKKIFEIDKGWNDVKKNINSKQIKEFYEFYADIWHPKTDILSLLSKTQNVVRGLYVGLFEVHNINEILHMLLFFDELIIIDPIPNPWYIKEEYNPISNPEKFKQATLKVLYLHLKLEPFVSLGRIKIIPSPFFYGSIEFKKALDLSMKRTYSLNHKVSEKIKKETKVYSNLNKLETYLLTPSKYKAQLMKKAGVTQDFIDESINFVQYLKENHPVALDQDLDKLDQISTVSTLNLETAFFIASELGCIPITNSPVKEHEFNEIYGKDRGEFKKMLKCFDVCNLKIIDNVDSMIIFDMQNDNNFSRYNSIFKDLYSRIRNRQFKRLKSDSMINFISNELKKISNNFDTIRVISQKKYPNKISTSTYSLKIITSVRGAKITAIDDLYKLKGRSIKFEYAPFSISFIKCD